MRRIFLAIVLSLTVSLPAAAQALKLAFNEGRVSLDATSVPVRTILVEWGRLGGTKVIGAERIAGSPLTLKLEDVPESQALEIVLRSVAGYMAAPRSASIAGASMFDRILVLATSATPPAAAARPAPNQPGTGGNPRFVPPRQPRQADNEDVEPEEEEDPNPPNAPVFTFPQPGQIGQPTNTGTPESITINPANPGSVPTFGVPRPGMIAAPPPQPTQPGTVVRPPGGA